MNDLIETRKNFIVKSFKVKQWIDTVGAVDQVYFALRIGGLFVFVRNLFNKILVLHLLEEEEDMILTNEPFE